MVRVPSTATRREFLATSSLAVAGLALASPRRLFAIPARARQSVGSFAPQLIDPETLRQFARSAIDAATHAGATFADVRVSDRRQYSPGGPGNEGYLSFNFGCGVRVRVGEHEAFAATGDPTPDSVARAARAAVATARALSAVSAPPAPLLPTPPATGEWVSPREIDPFTVSPDEHAFVQSGYTTFGRKHGVTIGGGIAWGDETRVFASSDGALITQRKTTGSPYFRVEFRSWRTLRLLNWITVPTFSSCTAGFELALGPECHARFETAVDELAELMTYPFDFAEVGRRDVVLDGHAFGALVGGTLMPALSLSRVLNEDQDSVGTSFLSPPESIVGQALLSPLLNMGVVQGAPHHGAAQWDDEGAVATSFPLIERGAVVNYLGTRATLAELPNGVKPRTSPGIAFASEVMTLPGARPGTLGVQPNATGESFAELVKSLGNGYIVRNAWAEVDQQASSGTLHPYIMFEVRQGKIVRRVIKGRLEFASKKVLSALASLGNESSLCPATGSVSGGMPWSNTEYVITAPAAIIRDVNIASNHASFG